MTRVFVAVFVAEWGDRTQVGIASGWRGDGDDMGAVGRLELPSFHHVVPAMGLLVDYGCLSIPSLSFDQVAMITLHSSAPWLPVCLGSLVAFLLLTFSAVAAATLVQHAKLSERFVLAFSAASFFIFAGLAVHDGLAASPR